MEPYIGEIRMFGGTFAPYGWQYCDGQLVSISENDALFALIGTTYGGDGVQNFALPDLRSRVPVHPNGSIPLAQNSGSETVTLTTAQIPAHTHAYNATTSGANTGNPSGALLASGNTVYLVSTLNPPQVMDGRSIGVAGGNQPHENRMPYLGTSFIISMFGIYPSPS